MFTPTSEGWGLIKGICIDQAICSTFSLEMYHYIVLDNSARKRFLHLLIRGLILRNKSKIKFGETTRSFKTFDFLKCKSASKFKKWLDWLTLTRF